MANIPPIQIKRSSTPGALPNPATMVPGELAINLVDKKLFTVDNSNNLVYLGNRSVDTVSDLLSLTNIGDGEIYAVKDSKTIWIYDGSEWIVNEPDVDFADSTTVLLAANFDATVNDGRKARVVNKIYLAGTGTWNEQATGLGAVYVEYPTTAALKTDYDSSSLTVGGVYYVLSTDSFFIVTNSRLEPLDRICKEFSAADLATNFPSASYKSFEGHVLNATTLRTEEKFKSYGGASWVSEWPLDVYVARSLDQYMTEVYPNIPAWVVVTPTFLPAPNERSTGENWGAVSNETDQTWTTTLTFTDSINGGNTVFAAAVDNAPLSSGFRPDNAWNSNTTDFWANNGSGDVQMLTVFASNGFPHRFWGENWDTGSAQIYQTLQIVVTYDDATTETVTQNITVGTQLWDLSFNANCKEVDRIALNFSNATGGNPGGRRFRFGYWRKDYDMQRGLNYIDAAGNPALLT